MTAPVEAGPFALGPVGGMRILRGVRSLEVAGTWSAPTPASHWTSSGRRWWPNSSGFCALWSSATVPGRVDAGAGAP